MGLWRSMPGVVRSILLPLAGPARRLLGLPPSTPEAPWRPWQDARISDAVIRACFEAIPQTPLDPATHVSRAARPSASNPSPTLRVLHGPFQGMSYRSVSWGSALPPKLLGSYEEPIHDWIEEAIAADYRSIVNLGCAEGFYAIGFARRCPGVKVMAFDPVQPAASAARDLADLNGVEVDVRAQWCTPRRLRRLATPGTLLFVDIEGGELELLDPDVCPPLADVDLIVETHDCFRPGITDTLMERFGATHTIEVRVDTPDRSGHYPLPDDQASDPELLAALQDEQRPPGMRWLRLLARRPYLGAPLQARHQARDEAPREAPREVPPEAPLAPPLKA